MANWNTKERCQEIACEVTTQLMQANELIRALDEAMSEAICVRDELARRRNKNALYLKSDLKDDEWECYRMAGNLKGSRLLGNLKRELLTLGYKLVKMRKKL